MMTLEEMLKLPGNPFVVRGYNTQIYWYGGSDEWLVKELINKENWPSVLCATSDLQEAIKIFLEHENLS